MPINILDNETVAGTLSSSSTIYDGRGGNSNQWDTTYATVTALSGNWQSTYATVCVLSANWNTAYNITTAYSSASSTFATNTLLQSTSALLTPLTTTNTLTGLLVTYTALNLSAGNWQSVYSLVNTTTATTFNVKNLSATVLVNALSANFGTLILSSPNGTRYTITVTNSGTLSAALA
jgi:type IV secretory pathway VirB6-like protein